MTHKRLISAAAGSLLAVSILAGCSEAEDLANEAKDSAASAASDAASSAKDAASGAASDAKSAGESAMADATGGNGAGKGGLTLDLGKFENDPNAKVVGSFYEARQTAVESGGDDTAALKEVTSATLFKQTSRVAAKADADLPFTAQAVAVNGSTVDMCVGPDERLRPRTLTVADGKVTKNATGKHSC